MLNRRFLADRRQLLPLLNKSSIMSVVIKFHKIFLVQLLLLVPFLHPTVSFGQTSSTSPADSVIQKAMADELERSIKELSYEDYAKPFFISYRIKDINSISVSATLGALIHSGEYPLRNKSVRVMVGDYSFNDESLDVASANGSESLSDISIPIENDYYGIRRSLWVTTDAVYKSAAKAFRENEQYVKQQSIPLEELPHRRFVKTPVVQLNIEGEPSSVNKKALEDRVKELSALFRSEADIQNSIVNISTFSNTNYFLNSEGTKVRFPERLTSMQVFAEIKTDQGESVYDQIIHYSFTPESLPSQDSLKKEIHEMIARLKALKNTQVFEDSYTGPVLFVGESVGSVFALGLFGYEGLVASNDISVRTAYQSTGFNLDDKIGRKILADGISVKSLPTLKTFNGLELPGTYQIDAEGVVPPSQLTLVKDGTLVALLSDRTASGEKHVSNGHSVDYQLVAPGVIEVSSDIVMPYSSLKKKLIDLAKEEGLPYALIIKRIPYGNYMAVNVYQVSLDDGTEKLLRLGQVKPLSMRALKRIKGASDRQIVFNTQSAGAKVSSFIVPDALLVEEVEVEGSKGPYLGNKMIVENPIKTESGK